MKKSLIILMSLVACFALVGCDKKEDCSNCNLDNCEYRK